MDTFELVLNEINKTLKLWIEGFAANLPNILVAVFIIVIFYGLSAFISKWVRKLLDQSSLHASLKVLLSSLVRILLVTFGVFFALGVVGLDKTVVSLMAGVGVIGLALGFAFKDLASNLISGLFIAIQNPFDIGDSIKINNISGTVEMIRLRDTILSAGNGQKIYIPNKSFMEDALYNLSQTAEKRFDLSVGISYEDDLGKVIEVLQQDLSKVANLKAGKKVTVQVKEFGTYSVILEINMWIDFPGVDSIEFSNMAMVQIKNSLQKNGFHMPQSPKFNPGPK
jgi:small conductance mechanosensitive channel